MPMASVPDIPMAPNREDWYKALADENCKSLMELLTHDKRLLDEGWKADTRASVRFNLERSWKGRTALHAAARRGHAELTKYILKIYSESLGEAKVQDYRPRLRSKKSDLLEVIDGDYELDALAIAVVNGNREIVNLLNSPTNLDGLSAKPEDGSAEDRIRLDALEARLKEITTEVLPEGSPDYIYVKDKYYNEDCDFNFLPLSVYLFHFTFSTWEINEKLNGLMSRIREEILSRALADLKLLTYLLGELWDGQGRTPLHVAVDSQKVAWFRKLIRKLILPKFDKKTHDEFLNQTDSAGRTPLYRAAAKNQMRAVEELLKNAGTNVGAVITYRADKWGADLDLDRLSRKNGFKSDAVYILEEKLKRKGFNYKSNAQAGPDHYVKPLEEVHSTALHVAIIHKHEEIVKKLVSHILRHGKRDKSFYKICGRRFTRPASRVSKDDTPDADKSFYKICRRRFNWPASRVSKDDTPDPCQRAVSTMELAVLVGSIPILQQLLEANELKPDSFSDKAEDEDLRSFLLVAASGNPGLIKAFLDEKFDPSKFEDSFGNTALHYALKGTNIEFHPHLVDFVGCNHVLSWRWANSDWTSDWLANPEESSTEPKHVSRNVKSDLKEIYDKRKLSIDLLFQAGIDIWKKNAYMRMASPEPDAPHDFVSWWYTKVTQERQQLQAKLNAAANAISVTGALVATASFVGPLQPPLGYGGSGDIQVDILSVRVYVVCDSLSFFLALAAIILSLVPSLPLSTGESMSSDLRRTSDIVAVSMTFLLPSILCVLMAFASGYIAVIPDNGLARGGIAVATTVFGGSLVFAVILWFLFYMVWRKVLKPLHKLRGQARAKTRAKTRALATLRQDLSYDGSHGD